MKLWLRILIGMALGIVLGLLLPLNAGDTVIFFRSLAVFIINAGRYLLFPLVFFSVAMSSYELFNTKGLYPVIWRSLSFIILSTVILSLIGGISIFIFSPQRVPIIIEESPLLDLPVLEDILFQIFPPNALTVFTNGEGYLFPLFLFSFLLGLGFHLHKTYATSLVDLFDSASRVFYQMNRVVAYLMSGAISVLAAYRLMELREIADFDLFIDLVGVVLFNILLVVFLVIPLITYFILGKKNPFPILLSVLSSVFVSLFSGDHYLSTTMLNRDLKDEDDIPRRHGASMIPFAGVFGRAGTAMVTVISFILVLRSYSSLDVNFGQFLWVLGSAISVSFMLGLAPGNGVMVSLAVLSLWYGQGLEESYLILLPISPILIGLTVAMDTVVNGYIVALISHQVTPKEHITRDL